jgi:signal transduction histidine kinase/ligand-binding sensor domain-containing protein
VPALWVGAEEAVRQRAVNVEGYRVSYWTSEHGLPQNTVSGLVQSRDGYLWIGTRYGLVRYDGVRFQVFVQELSELDPDQLDVRGMVEDARGSLWVHSWHNLARFQAGRFESVPLRSGADAGKIQHLCAGREGGLWISRAKELLHLADGAVERRFPLSQLAGNTGADEVEQVVEASANEVYVRLRTGLNRHGWQRLNWRSGAIENLTNVLGVAVDNIGCLRRDTGGRLWVGAVGEVLRLEEGRLTRYPAGTNWAGQLAREIALDLRGNLWVVTSGPTQLHRLSENQFISYHRSRQMPGIDDVRSLLPDREGNVWVGTGSEGVHRYQPRQLVSLLTGSFSTGDEVYSVAPGQGGVVWLATPYGLVRYQNEQFQVFTNVWASEMLNGVYPRVRPVYEDRAGQVFFGFDSVGLMTLQDGQFVPVAQPQLQGPDKRFVRCILDDRAGSLWLATQRGLLQRREDRYRLWTKADGLSDDALFGLAEGPDGSLWIGSERGGVNRFNDGRFRTYGKREGLLSDNAWPLRVEADGAVWVGTPRGLNRIRGDEVRSVTMQQGLFDNIAYCLLEDHRSNYWSFCNRGIWRVSQAGLHAVADGKAPRVACLNYGEDDGMASSEGNGDQQPNAATLPNGELWFPTTRGVVRLHPDQLRDNQVRPLVVIEEVRADEETVFRDGLMWRPSGEASAPQSRINPPGQAGPTGSAGGGPVLLPPGRARVLEIRYTANTFIDSDKANFRYRLEGYDEGWRDADTRRVAVYTNLRPGRYRFVVEARNHHGYWSQAPAVFSIALAPHVYEARWFHAACGLAVVLGALGWHRRRLAISHRFQQLQHQRQLEEERSRIAKDLHDDLGASLTGVALELEAARKLNNQPGAQAKRLAAIAHSLRLMAGRMREVVWTVNPQCDTLESFSSFLCRHAETFLAPAGLACRLDVPVDLPARRLSAEARHHLLLVAKEALNNTVRHAAASEVRLGLAVSNGTLVMSLEDNGRGFDPSGLPRTETSPPGDSPRQAPEAGRGLSNMRRRAQTLGGQFDLRSSVGRGTRITVRVPLPSQK